MEIIDWLVIAGFGPTAIVVMAAVMAAVMAVVVAGSCHAVQCSWAVIAAYHLFAVYSHNAQQFMLLH